MQAEKRNRKQQFVDFMSRLLPLYKQYEEATMDDDTAESWDRVNRRIADRERRTLKRRILYFTSAAACLALLAGSLWMNLPEKRPADPTLTDTISKLSVPAEQAQEVMLITADEQQLRVADNTDVKYNPDGSVQVNSGTIDQSITTNPKEETTTTYNQLFVPKGKRTNITFADGTRIFVNSGTRVIYPAVFANDKREIYVDGEICLEVKRDESRPFYVKTDKMDVRVLGTTFNVCAYHEDEESSVVLVNGKVEVETNRKEKVTLSPDELFSMQSSGISTHKVEAAEYISWTQNMMIFHQEPLSKVLTRLSRYYGKEIACEADLGKMTISGKLDLRDHMEDVLDIIATAAPLAFNSSGQTITVALRR